MHLKRELKVGRSKRNDKKSWRGCILRENWKDFGAVVGFRKASPGCILRENWKSIHFLYCSIHDWLGMHLKRELKDVLLQKALGGLVWSWCILRENWKVGIIALLVVAFMARCILRENWKPAHLLIDSLAT